MWKYFSTHERRNKQKRKTIHKIYKRDNKTVDDAPFLKNTLHYYALDATQSIPRQKF